MLSVQFDIKDLQKTLKNTIDYSNGFFEGITIEKIEFNKRLGEYTAEALKLYIDAQARGNPDAFHHVYEWNMVGDPSARLFSFSSKATNNLIMFVASFKQSKSVSDTSTEPFTNKAEVMENSMTVTIEPKMSDLLVFDYNNETIFTSKTITIEDPGGPFVAGSFEKTVNDFFTQYLTSSLLQPYLMDLSKADEFTRSFGSVRSSGAKSSGVKAGKAYLRVTGSVIQ